MGVLLVLATDIGDKDNITVLGEVNIPQNGEFDPALKEAHRRSARRNLGQI